MSAPKMPGHTCPMIDKLKRRIQEAHKLAGDVPEGAELEDLRGILAAIEHELQGEADVLEDLRDANLGLRNCAEYWQEEAARLESGA